jgi:hypothetical protein
MSNDLGWPAWIQIDLETFEIHSPPVILREFAGIYGESFGFTHQTGTQNGVRTFAESHNQDAFRHAFVHGTKALELWDKERYLNTLPIAPITKTNEALFDSIVGSALWWGFANEFTASNVMPQHLQDLWNNGVGVDLAREFMLSRSGNRQTITNDEFAAFVADKIKVSPQRFIMDFEHDPRASNPSNFNLRYLPDRVEYSHRFVMLLQSGRLTTDLMAQLHAMFPDRYVEQCFLAGTMITMADGSRKPIEDIRAGDWVLSFDGQGILKPGRVSRTMTNDVRIILDFHGTFVTPGHVFYCAGGTYKGKFVPLIDILRDDGIVQDRHGTLIRAATGCVVGSEDDRELWAFTIYNDEDGNERVKQKGKLRLGTRWMRPDGRHFSVREYLTRLGGELLDCGYIGFSKTGQKLPFAWVLSDTIPNPEDFILARSKTTLQDIYSAAEWEMPPQKGFPTMQAGSQSQPVAMQRSGMSHRNEPFALKKITRTEGVLQDRRDRQSPDVLTHDAPGTGRKRMH